jgi:hypothetical protein
MADRRAEAHRRIAKREHGVEQRMLSIASELSNPEGVRKDAREISQRADKHEETADRIERDAD